MGKSPLYLFGLAALAFQGASSNALDLPLVTFDAEPQPAPIQTEHVLKQVDNAYGFDVKLGTNPTQNSFMMLSLYSSYTFLAESCYAFAPTTCDTSKGCEEGAEDIPIAENPYIAITGRTIKTKVPLLNDFWTANPSSKVVIAKKCTDGAVQTYGEKSSGMLGMGYDGDAASNYAQTAESFSLIWDTEKNVFKMTVNPVVSLETYMLRTTFKTTKNWKAEGLKHIQVGSLAHEVNADIIFDINTNSIGLPKSIYDKFVHSFKSYKIECDATAKEFASCTVEGSYTLRDLPVFKLHQGSEMLRIQPKRYVLDSDKLEGPVRKFKLNVRLIGPQETGANHIKVDNTVVLGAELLKHYETVFNRKTNTIQLYIQNPPGTGYTKYWIFGGCSIGCVVIGLILLIFTGRAKPRSESLVAPLSS